MKLRRLWLALTALLFAAWIGWLGYLVATTIHPVILSRPQFLAADLVVIGDVGGDLGRPAGIVTVEEAYGPPPASDLRGKRITIANLSDCRPGDGWKGPGRYILALVREEEEHQLARIPPSPGFPTPTRDDRPRIYMEDHETRHQLEEIWHGRPGGSP